MSDTGQSTWKYLIDANVHHGVGSALAAAGHDVAYVNDAFLPGATDDEVDQYARSLGKIIVSHDTQFLRRIQQRTFQFDEPISLGYGRIMLCGNEPNQPERIAAVRPILDLYLRWAAANKRRFLAAIGDSWIRFDDLPRTVDVAGRRA